MNFLMQTFLSLAACGRSTLSTSESNSPRTSLKLTPPMSVSHSPRTPLQSIHTPQSSGCVQVRTSDLKSMFQQQKQLQETTERIEKGLAELKEQQSKKNTSA